MTDTNLLEQAIKSRGLKKYYIAKKLGVTRVSLTNLINNRAEFKASQIQILSDLLELTEAQKSAIFFARNGV